MTDDDVIARVRYFDQQFLRVQDFQDEQDYHVRGQRLHNISGHTWGIVGGLDVTVTARAVTVSPGSAVDEHGRVIVLAHRATRPLPARGEIFDMRIRYAELDTDQVDDGCGVLGAYRVREEPRLELRSNLQADDDDEQAWVFLGRVAIDPLRPGDDPVVRLEERRYTGLVGVTVQAPSQAAALRFGGGPGRGSAAGTFEILAQAPGAAEPSPVLTISGDGTAELAGDLTVTGSLTLDGEDLVFGSLPKQTDAAAALVGSGPSGAAALQSPPDPWSVRQVIAPLPEPPVLGRPAPPAVPQIQIVLPDPVAGQEPAAFAIGTWSKDDQRFVPVMTVHADGNVDIPGTLRVGALKGPEGDEPPPGTVVDGGLDPEAQRMVTAAGMSGVAGGSGLANALYRPGTGTVQQEAPSPLSMVAEGTDAEEPGPGLAGALAVLLASDEALRGELARRLTADHPVAAQDLRVALPTPAAVKKAAVKKAAAKPALKPDHGG